MKGLILAAGRSQRMQDMTASQNKVLLDLGGDKTILENLLDGFEAIGTTTNFVVAGFDAAGVRNRCRDRASVLFNPFWEHYGILSSLWLARSELYATAFLASVGDHYLELSSLRQFRKEQPEAAILAQVELKKCDDEDMKVFIDSNGRLQTISKVWSGGCALGEFTGLVRFSALGSRLFFDTLAEFAWTKGVKSDVFMADVLMACHHRQHLAFQLSHDHRRRDIDYPSDYHQACEFYQTRVIPPAEDPPSFDEPPADDANAAPAATADELPPPQAA